MGLRVCLIAGFCLGMWVALAPTAFGQCMPNGRYYYRPAPPGLAGILMAPQVQQQQNEAAAACASAAQQRAMAQQEAQQRQEQERRDQQQRAADEAAAQASREAAEEARQAAIARAQQKRAAAQRDQAAAAAAVAQETAEKAPDNYCRAPEVARMVLSAFNDLPNFKTVGIEAADIEHVTTRSAEKFGSNPACHGTFMLTNGERLTGVLQFRKNVAGDWITVWKRD